MDDPIRLDGDGLDCAQVVAAARAGRPVAVTEAGYARAAAAHAALAEVRAPVYGRTTGVGANRSIAAEPDGHGLRLLRSHSCDAGPALPVEVARAMLVVRLNQLARGGSGVDPALLGALATAINRGVTPPLYRFGAIGTGDLTALAAAALCLAGERAWAGGSAPAYRFADADALAFISSNAATLGEAALAADDLRHLLDATVEVAAQTATAIGASGEPFAPEVQAARPHPGQLAVAEAMRGRLTPAPRPAARVQDPYGVRAFASVHGVAVDAARRLTGAVQAEMNSAPENPLVTGAGVFHNGNFHSAALAAALDAAVAALAQTAALSVARLANLMDPGITGRRAFLAGGPDGSSGLLILEYVAHSALAELRHQATTSAGVPATLSLGTEDHASFATQAAGRLRAAVAAYPTVVACELVAARRAAGGVPEEDRDLSGDVAAAERWMRAR